MQHVNVYTDTQTHLLLLLLDLLHQDGSLLILASLVLKPHPDHPGTQTGHLGQLLFHQGVGPGVGVVACP